MIWWSSRVTTTSLPRRSGLFAVTRDGSRHQLAFSGGAVIEPLQRVGDAPKRASGTRVRAWPDAQFFDSPHFPVAELERLLCSKASVTAAEGAERVFRQGAVVVNLQGAIQQLAYRLQAGGGVGAGDGLDRNDQAHFVAHRWNVLGHPEFRALEAGNDVGAAGFALAAYSGELMQAYATGKGLNPPDTVH